MFDHVTIRATDRRAAERFYDTVLQTLGFGRPASGETCVEWDDFSVAQAESDDDATAGLHIGFRAPSHDLVHRFWQAGIDAGHRDDGEPGPRPVYGDDYYGGFLLDPDGNSAEAACHDNLRRGGCIDHVWMRVADVAASKAFYETVAPHAGFHLTTDTPERAQFSSGNGSFSAVAGTPSRNVHLAFPGDNAAVDAFHAAATAAGYSDNGAPGERAEYHDGYYAAFVLDPDGNNVEVVSHNR